MPTCKEQLDPGLPDTSTGVMYALNSYAYLLREVGGKAKDPRYVAQQLRRWADDIEPGSPADENGLRDGLFVVAELLDGE